MNEHKTVVAGVVVEAPAVSRYVAEINGFLRVFDQIFQLLANRLPPLMKDVRSLIDGITVLEQDSNKKGLFEALERTKKFSEAFKNKLLAVLETNSKVLAAAGPLVEAVHTVANTLRQIDSLSDDIGLIGLNASVTAVRSGSEGAAFAALTQALTQLTETSAQVAGRFHSASQGIHDEAQGMMELQRTLEEGLNEVARGWREKMEEAVEGIVSVLKLSEESLGGVATKANDVLSSTGRIMSSIQRQDILRQGLEQIVVVLQAVLAEYQQLVSLEGANPQKGLNFLAFEKRATGLCSRVLFDIESDLRRLFGDVDQPLSDLRMVAMELRNAQETIGKRIAKRLVASAQHLATTVEGAHAKTGGFDSYRAIAERLSNFAEQVPSMLRELAEIVRHLRVINVLIKAEVARSHKLKRAHSITGEIDQAQQTFGHFVAQAEAALTELKQTLDELDYAIGEVGRRRADLGTSAKELVATLDDLREAGDELNDSLGGVVSAGAKLEASVAGFKRGMSSFESAIEVTSEVGRACQRLEQQSEDGLVRLRKSAKLENYVPSLGTLEELIDRFTVYSHKLVAGQTVELDIEQGQDEGELTLF